MIRPGPVPPNTAGSNRFGLRVRPVSSLITCEALGLNVKWTVLPASRSTWISRTAYGAPLAPVIATTSGGPSSGMTGVRRRLHPDVQGGDPERQGVLPRLGQPARSQEVEHLLPVGELQDAG